MEGEAMIVEVVGKPLGTVVILLSLLITASHRDSPPPVDTSLALSRCVLGRPPVARWSLPDRYREVSGLAAFGDSAVLIHGDERARVGVFDLVRAEVTREFQPVKTLTEDFEGIALVDDGIALMTSDGRLFLAIRFDSVPPDFEETNTGFSRFCELEGLAWEPGSRVLLFPCKTPKDSRLVDALVVFRWSLDDDAPADPTRLMVLPPALRRAVGTTLFRATAIDVDPVTRHLLVLSSAPVVVVELDLEGHVLGSARLDRNRHPRPEGIAVVGKLLLIADEGVVGDTRGTITAYACSS